MSVPDNSLPDTNRPEQPTLKALALYFLKLGTLGFGGPIALAGRLEKELVDERRWVPIKVYSEGLAFSQLSPGPLAAQLAMYVGWVRRGAVGAMLTGMAFVLPSFLMVLVLAALYVRYGWLTWIPGLFYGISAAVIAIMAQSAYRLARRILGTDRFLWLLFAAVAIATAWTESEMIFVFLLSGILTLWVKTRRSLVPKPAAMSSVLGFAGPLTGVHGAASAATIGKLLLFFLKAGAFVFGSGLAIVPFLYGGVVGQHHWLSERQFLDAVAVAMITPGPVVISAAFIGYLVAGPIGATTASLAVFAPPYLIVLAGAPYYRRLVQNRQVSALVQGVTVAAVGAIAGAAYLLGRRTLIDLPTVLISFAVLTLRLAPKKKIPEPLLILGAGIAGLVLFEGA